MRLGLALLALALVGACTSPPRLGAGIGIGPGGVHIYPSISGSLGGARVSVSP